VQGARGPGGEGTGQIRTCPPYVPDARGQKPGPA